MKLSKQLEYHLWAEMEFYKVIEGIDADRWKLVHLELQKSLQNLYIHKVEVMWFWFQLMKEIEPKDAPNFDKLDKEQLFSLMFDLFEDIRKFLITKQNSELMLNLPMFEKKYHVTIYELLFNILNHHTYHRGQIAMLLKKYNLSFPETDYNPYMYHKLDLLK